MFTGIIQEVGRVRTASARGGNLLLNIEGGQTSPRLKIGDSVSVNGACQTVVSGERDHFSVEAIAETISRTTLGELKSGSRVNLELPMNLNDLLHGHLVQGHVDCTGKIKEIKPISGSTVLTVEYPKKYGRYLIEKGSVAVDGVSLTVVETSSGSFKISIIPHTITNTVFLYRKAGDMVNLEFDMLAKYVEKMVAPQRGDITIDFLKEHGF